AKLTCETNTCAPSSVAKAWVRSVAITLVDDTDPVLTNVGGSLLGGGWLRGVQTLSVTSSDTGSGVSSVCANVNGMPVGGGTGACRAIVGSPFAAGLSPCLTDV